MMIDHSEFQNLQGSEPQSFSKADDAELVMRLGWRYEVLLFKAGNIAARPFRFAHKERAEAFIESLTNTLKLVEDSQTFDIHFSSWEYHSIKQVNGIKRDSDYARELREAAGEVKVVSVGTGV